MMMTVNEGRDSGVVCHPPSSSIMMKLRQQFFVLSIGTGAIATFH